jgi:mycothiol synthase
VGLPSGYSMRAPSPDEVDAVAAVLAAADVEAGGTSVLDADFLRDEWTRAGFDLATDAWVVTGPDAAIVAYGETMLEEPGVVESWGVVHPEHRGRGIGDTLLGRIERRAAEQLAGSEPSKFRHAVNAGDVAAGEMLRARGLELVRHFWHMQIDLAGPVDAGPAPPGIEIRPPETDELETVHEIMDEAFAEDWGYRPQAFDEWMADYARSPRYDPTSWLLAREAGDAVAALTVIAGEDRAWVAELGVRSSHRGRGVGGALLRHSIAELARRGVPAVVLNVDAANPTGATALYERAGMRVVGRWDLWERLGDRVPR